MSSKEDAKQEVNGVDVSSEDVLAIYEMLQKLSADDLRVLFTMYYVNNKKKYREWLPKDSLRGKSFAQISQMIKKGQKSASCKVIESAFDTANLIFKSFLKGKSVKIAKIQEILDKVE